MTKGPISQFITHNYRHFNSAALVDAAKGYEAHLERGGKMMITLGGGHLSGRDDSSGQGADHYLYWRQPRRGYHEPGGTLSLQTCSGLS